MLPNLLVYLIAQKQIIFNGITIYQKSLNEMLDCGIDKYNMLILPFLLDIDDFEFENKNLIQNMNIFDILILDKNTFTMLLNSISFFCETNKIDFDEQKGVLYIGDGYIDRNNFDEFADIILKINAKQKVQKEKPPENMTPKERDIWNKLQAGRQRKLEKSQIDLSDLINICQFGGDYYISNDIIFSWTMFNLTRCYKSIIGKSNFKELFDIYCVTGEEKLIKNQHWTDLIKLENNKEEFI
jgi:hypothetical protein